MKEKPKSEAHGGETDFEFRRHLRDTIVLLGGSADFADLLANCRRITKRDVDELRKYNVGLVEEIKNRLARVNRIKLRLKSSWLA